MLQAHLMRLYLLPSRAPLHCLPLRAAHLCKRRERESKESGHDTGGVTSRRQKAGRLERANAGLRTFACQAHREGG